MELFLFSKGIEIGEIMSSKDEGQLPKWPTAILFEQLGVQSLAELEGRKIEVQEIPDSTDRDLLEFGASVGNAFRTSINFGVTLTLSTPISLISKIAKHNAQLRLLEHDHDNTWILHFEEFHGGQWVLERRDTPRTCKVKFLPK